MSISVRHGRNVNADVMRLAENKFSVIFYTKPEPTQIDVVAKDAGEAIDKAGKKLREMPKQSRNVQLKKIAGFGIYHGGGKWSVFFTKLAREFKVENCGHIDDAESKALEMLRNERENERKRAARGW